MPLSETAVFERSKMSFICTFEIPIISIIKQLRNAAFRRRRIMNKNVDPINLHFRQFREACAMLMTGIILDGFINSIYHRRVS